MNAQKRSLLVSALLVFGLVNSTFADVLVLKDGTLVDGDVDSLLRGTNKTIQTPDGRSVGLSDAVATHLGVTAKELKAGIDRSSFTSEGVTIRLNDAYIFERVKKETTERLLQITVEVTNRDERRYLSLVSPRGFFSNNYEYRLKDDVSNEIRKSSTWNDLHGDHKRLRKMDRIEPEKTATGAILFEPPLPKTKYLVLDLAPQMFEFNEKIAFIGTAFLLIPFDSVSTPKSRLLAPTEAVERYERTAADADQTVAKKLLDRVAEFGDGELAKLYARWKLVPFEHTVSHLENTSQSMQSIDWSKIDALRAASEQASDEEVRDSLLGLCRRAALAIVKHGEATLETNLDSAVQDYWIARLLSVDSNGKTKTPSTPIKPARALSNPNPTYPPDAVQQGIEGRAILSVTIAVSGLVTRVMVAESSGHKSLDQAALDAVRRWRFAPATRGGKPVEWTARLPIRFRL